MVVASLGASIRWSVCYARFVGTWDDPHQARLLCLHAGVFGTQTFEQPSMSCGREWEVFLPLCTFKHFAPSLAQFGQSGLRGCTRANFWPRRLCVFLVLYCTLGLREASQCLHKVPH